MSYKVGDKIRLPNGATGEVKKVLNETPPYGDIVVQYRDKDSELRCRILDPETLTPRRSS